MNKITLQEAIQYVKDVTPENNPWVGADLSEYETSELVAYVDDCIATILNAVVSGDLVVKNDREQG